MAPSCRNSAVILLIILTVILNRLNDAESARNLFQSIPANTGCVCPGEVLTFYCTAVGSGNTQWGGTAFNCSGDGIILRHQRFADPGGVAGACNAGAIQGRSVSVENDCFTSRIDFTFTTSFNNKTVSCTHTSDLAVNTIGTSILIVFEAFLLPPNDIHLVHAHARELMFMWTPPVDAASCTAVNYGILSDCGVCPATTNSTNVSCSIVHLSRGVFNCTFSVHSIICGTNSHPSEAINATLKAPNVPRVKIIPMYSEQRVLLGFIAMINKEEPFVIANGIFGNITGYNFYINSDKQSSNYISCNANACEFMINVQNSDCSKAAKVNVTISANNILREGPVSDLLNIDCTNEFVMVKVNSASTILCIFLDELQTSEKSCSVLYGPCDQTLTLTSSANATSGRATLQLELSDLGHEYCYILTASNSTYEIMINGRIDVHRNSTRLVAIITPIIVITMLLILFVIVGIILSLHVTRKRNKRTPTQSDTELNVGIKLRFTDDDLQPIDLNEKWITKWKVEHATSIKEFIENKGLVYKRGYVYYEFINSIESISADKQLIFMKKNTNTYFSLIDDSNREFCEDKLMGEIMLQPFLNKYDVYVQSTGSGRRHICGSSLLYMRLQPHPLWHVDQQQIGIKEISKTTTVEAFCDENRLGFIYIQLDIKSCKYEKKTDVILQDVHVDTQGLFTGPFALMLAEYRCTPKQRQQSVRLRSNTTDSITDVDLHKESGMTKYADNVNSLQSEEEHHCPHGVDIDSVQYRIFVTTCKKDLKLKEGTEVLYHKQQSVEKSLIPIFSEQFATTMLSSDCTLEVVKQQHDLDIEENNIFVEIDAVSLNGNTVLDVILMDKNEEKYFTSPRLRYDVNSLSSSYDKKTWRIFILHRFDRHLNLRKRTWVLYRVNKNPWRNNGLIPIDTGHWQFQRKDVKEGQKYKKNLKEKHLFILEEGSFQEDREIKSLDVILMDKCGRYFSGPYARRMFEEQKRTEDVWRHWRVFVVKLLGKCNIESKSDSIIWCQFKQEALFHVLKVDDDNVRMSEYIQRKLTIQYENGKAFYEFSEDEDLLHYKEVALFKTSKDDQFNKVKEVKCEVFPFYKISGAPDMSIKSTSTDKEKWFIQSLSQGSRCLKSGTLLLYKKT